VALASNKREATKLLLDSWSNVVRRVPDCSIPALLAAVTTLFLSYPSSTPDPPPPVADSLPGLDAGYPFLSLLHSAPHLAQYLSDPLTTLLAAAASPSRALPASLSLLSHLRPFLLAALASPTSISSHAASFLVRAAAARPTLAQPIFKLLQGFLHITASCAPTKVPAAAFIAAWGLSDAVSEAVATSSSPDGSGGASAHNVTWHLLEPLLNLLLELADRNDPVMQLAPPLINMLHSSLPCHTAGRCALLLAKASVCRAYTPGEPLFLYLLLKALDAAEPAVAVSLDVQLLVPQLLQHLSVPSDQEMYSLASQLLKHTLPTDTHPRPPLTSVPTIAPITLDTYTSALLVAQIGAASSFTVAAWLQRVACAAAATLSAPQQMRYQAVASAIRSGAIWPCPVPAESLSDAALDGNAPQVGCFVVAPDIISFLTVLLKCGSRTVSREAGAALAAVALAAPESTSSLIPWAISSINDAIRVLSDTSPGANATPHGVIQRHVAGEAVLLPFVLLPIICSSPFLEQPLLVVTSQLLNISAPPRVQALGIKLLLTFWQTTSRGWSVLFAALSAFGPAHGRSSHGATVHFEVRLAAAAAVAAVAQAAPERCLDVISVVGGMLQDADEAVVAMALESIFWLCFYVRRLPITASASFVQHCQHLSC
jgi:hypothetical protein